MQKRLLFTYTLRGFGALTFIWGLYNAFMIVSTQTIEARGPDYYMFSRISYLPFPQLLLFALLCGFLGYFAISFLFLGFSFLHAKIAYASVHIALWLGALSLWYQYAVIHGGINLNLWPERTSPVSLVPWLIVTSIGSIILVAFYSQLVRLLEKFFGFVKAMPVEHA